MADVTIRWGIIGCGDVTEKKSGPGFQRAVGSELVAVMRRNADLCADYAKRHNVPHAHSAVDDLLSDDSVTAVYVATPPGTHLEIARQVAAAGKPCYMEKPMARNYSESAEMLETFARSGVPLFVAYYRRAYPRYQKLKGLLDDGVLGELSAVHFIKRQRAPEEGAATAGWRSTVSTSGGGLFVDVGSHLLDLLDFLLGPLREVHGCASRAPGAPSDAPEDVVTMSFLASRAALGSASWNFRAAENLELLELVGDRARASLPDPMNGSLCIIEKADGSPPERWEEPPPSPSVQEPLIQMVVDAIRSGDPSRCPSTAESALRTAQYMDAVLGSFYAGRTDAFWERPESWHPNVTSDMQR